MLGKRAGEAPPVENRASDVEQQWPCRRGGALLRNQPQRFLDTHVAPDQRRELAGDGRKRASAHFRLQQAGQPELAPDRGEERRRRAR
jgi:hypothetical protein